MWFGNWEKFLVDKGFAVRDENEEFIISDAMLAKIINIDETCLSLDGSNGNWGGATRGDVLQPVTSPARKSNK